ncbi:MAG TPA: HAD family phosphatase [Candidatus Angelobacter sp.]|nr:HAD family phosphatase [Candidatus Angelobacter sp.]
MRGKIPSSAVFDLGGVLIDWNPRYLYRRLLRGDEAAVEHFLSTVCTQSWNEQQDAGRTFAEGSAVLKAAHPHHAELIDAWISGYEEMLGGEVEGSVEILSELRANQTRLYALSNWSAETFPFAERRFEFLRWFQGILLSGEAKLLKPDPRLFQILFEKFAVDPADAVYVDDQMRNVDAARRLGMYGIHFTDAGSLRRRFGALGLL